MGETLTPMVASLESGQISIEISAEKRKVRHKVDRLTGQSPGTVFMCGTSSPNR